MSCGWIEKVSLLVDGELTGEQARATLSHLETCDACRDARTDFLLFRRQLNSYTSETSVAARRQVLEAILSSNRAATPMRTSEESGVRLPRARWRGRFAGALNASRLAPAAALLVLMLMALGLLVYTTSRRAGQNARSLPASVAPFESATPGPADETDTQKPPDKREVVVATAGKPSNASRANGRSARAQRAVDLRNVAAAREPEGIASGGAQPLENVGGTTASTALRSGRARAQAGTLDAGRHVEQAQLLLRSFRNARLSDDDLAYEREKSKKLLYRNIVLRREAASKGDPQTEGLLDRLEPILIDIANLPDKPAKEEVASIRERVRKKNLVVSLQAVAPGQKDF